MCCTLPEIITIMPQIIFQGCSGASSSVVCKDVAAHTKILAVALRRGVPIRYGCGACRCGTCAVAITAGGAELSLMEQDEHDLLEDMSILRGAEEVRLSCRARVVSKDCSVDLSFQQTYDPAQRQSKESDIIVYSPKNRKSSPSSS